VGRRPTFYGSDGELLVEAHLLDFAGDLYGEEARVSFVARLHDDIAFPSTEALVDQIRRDVEDTRARLTPGG
jgi:riboflavin kinase/FMN adenylyltransferase